MTERTLPDRPDLEPGEAPPDQPPEEDDALPPVTSDERIDAASGTHEEITGGGHGDRGDPPGVNGFYCWTVR
jgi:hypothetical protein